MINNNFGINSQLITGENEFDIQGFSSVNLVKSVNGQNIDGPLRIGQDGLLEFSEGSQNIEVKQIDTSQYSFPSVFIKKNNNQTSHNTHIDYEGNTLQGITPDLFVPYTDINLNTSINNNSVLQYLNNQFVWQSITSPVITSISYDLLQNNTSTYPSFIIFNSSNVPSLSQNCTNFIPNNSILNSQIQSITFSKISDASAGLIVAQNNYQNTLLFYIYQNNQTLPPNDQDILVYHSQDQQFKHVSQGVLQIDHSQITGKLTLNQIEDINNNNRHYFTSNSGQNQFEDLTHLNQFIALGYDNNKYLQSTSNGYQWATISSISLNALLTALNSQTVVNQNQIQSDTTGNLTFWKSQSGTNSYSMLVLSDISNISAVLTAINNQNFVSITYLNSSGPSATQYVLTSANNTQNWTLTSSLSIAYNQLTGLSTAIQSIQTNNLVLASLVSGQLTIQQIAYGSNDGVPRVFQSLNNSNSWQPISSLQIAYSQLTSVPGQLTNLINLGYNNGLFLQSTTSGYQWANAPQPLSGNNRIYYNNSSGILSPLTGTNAIPYFNSSSQVVNLTSNTAGLVSFSSAGSGISVLPFSTTYGDNQPECLDRSGAYVNYCEVKNLVGNYLSPCINRIVRSSLTNFIYGFDLYNQQDDISLNKASFFISTDQGSGQPPLNSADTSFYGGIQSSTSLNQGPLFYSSNVRNIFAQQTQTLTLRMYLSTAWTWVSTSSRHVKKEIKNNDQLTIKHDLCEKLLKTKLHIYEMKDGCVNSRCKKNINRRKAKYIGPYLEDLVEDELFYHCVENIEDMEKDKTIAQQDIDENGYKMRLGLNQNAVTYQLMNIAREQAQRIIDLEQQNKDQERTIVELVSRIEKLEQQVTLLLSIIR